MKIKALAVTNLPTHPGVIQLKKSLIKHQVDNDIIVTPWQGFFTKVDEAYKYCKKTDADWIVFVDAHDVVFVDGIDAIKERITKFRDCDCIFSVEKACWPDPDLASLYPECESQWKYLNSGTYLFKPQKLVETVEKNLPKIGIDDQLYFHKHLLNENMDCVLDTNCEIFQTLAHDDGSSFGMVDGKFTNLLTNTNPIIVHGNGRSAETYDYSYINFEKP